jgi:hypothetical protein
MNEYEKLVPSETRGFVDRCVAHARELMQRDGALSPIAFVGTFNGGGIAIPALAMIPKDVAAKVITLAAKQADADFVLHIDEGWGLEAQTEESVKALHAKYGQVKDMPGRIDVVMFQFETYAGQFMAMPKREPFGEMFTFGEASFQLLGHAEGRFMGLLPTRGKAH